MADSKRRAALVAEICRLQRQQSESVETAIFCGWTLETKAGHDQRADRLELLLPRVAELDQTP